MADTKDVFVYGKGNAVSTRRSFGDILREPWRDAAGEVGFVGNGNTGVIPLLLLSLRHCYHLLSRFDKTAPSQAS
jgi:hypothetical protein